VLHAVADPEIVPGAAGTAFTINANAAAVEVPQLFVAVTFIVPDVVPEVRFTDVVP